MSRIYLSILAALSCAILILPTLATAQDRVLLGYGRLIANDLLGDGQDRWRSGSISSSWARGSEWTGELPTAFGALIEYRLLAENIAPANLVAPAAGDRRFSGAWSLGAHSHFQRRGYEFALGADLVITGPQTGLASFQSALHDLIGAPAESPLVQAGQIGNGFHPTLVAEAGRIFDLGGVAQLRPFVEGRWGSETLIRAGFDISIGQVGRGEFLVRDPVTGQRYRTIQTQTPGVAFVLGGDIAKVVDSIYLPAATHTLTATRQRLRAGLHRQGEHSSMFYGLTWLGEEFVGQGEGQVVGSLRLKLDF